MKICLFICLFICLSFVVVAAVLLMVGLFCNPFHTVSEQESEDLKLSHDKDAYEQGIEYLQSELKSVEDLQQKINSNQWEANNNINNELRNIHSNISKAIANIDGSEDNEGSCCNAEEGCFRRKLYRYVCLTMAFSTFVNGMVISVLSFAVLFAVKICLNTACSCCKACCCGCLDWRFVCQCLNDASFSDFTLSCWLCLVFIIICLVLIAVVVKRIVCVLRRCSAILLKISLSTDFNIDEIVSELVAIVGRCGRKYACKKLM